MRLRSISFLLVCYCLLLALNASADTIRSSKKNPVELPTDVRYVSTAPRSSPTRALRATLLVEEVYSSIGVDEIEFGAEESEPDRVVASHFLSGFDVAPLVGLTRFTALQFVRWNGPNEFVLREGEVLIRVRYLGDGAFELARTQN